jgi:hypothetical protein
VVAWAGGATFRQRALRRAQRVDRLVVRDPIQPGPQIPHARALPQRLPGADERRLQDVLRQLLGEQAPQVALQRTAVSLDDRLKGAIVAVAGQADQTAVGLRTQHWCGQQRRHRV